MDSNSVLDRFRDKLRSTARRRIARQVASQRRFRLETLEQRAMLSGTPFDLSQYMNIEYLDPQPDITTTDSPFNHIVGTGTLLDGVVLLEITTPTGAGIATGTLLPDGKHILTAAHIVANGPAGAVSATSVDVIFETPSGAPPISISPAGFNVHPAWNGVVASGIDLAILELPTAAPADAPRFDIMRSQNEFDQILTISGYGQAGQGQVQFSAGVKLVGNNVYEATFGNDILVYDFDSGLAANDAIGIASGGVFADLGLGNAESLAVGGDSGSPAFINGLIAGVHSFRDVLRDQFGNPIPGVDAIAGLNGSFGELSFDVRVSTQSPWIDSIIDVPGLPKVAEVIVSGSTSIHDPHLFSTVDDSGLQLQTVPVGGADTVSIQFSEHVLNIDATSLTLTGLTTGAVPTLAVGGFSYDVGAHRATWTFDAPFDADQYLLSLADSVTDVGTNALDGEWTNPFSVTTTNALVSEFPSGNGVAGGDFNFAFTILSGDHDLNNQGDGLGFLWWQRNYAPTATDKTFAEGDFDGDGDIDGDDLALWQSSYGMNLSNLMFADFNGDGVVDGDDEDIWDTWEGTGTTHAQGDANGDADVDATDLAILQMQFGLQLKWVA